MRAGSLDGEGSRGDMVESRSTSNPTVHPASMLVVISGLPGTGKTAVAAEIAHRLRALHLSIDPIEDAMLGAGLPAGWETGVAAYEVSRTVAEQHLARGWNVVVDAVNDSEAARQTWRDAADRTGAGLKFFLLVCARRDEHRRRLEGRQRDLRHVPEPTWQQVVERARAYEPWGDDCLMVAADAPLPSVVDYVEQNLKQSGH
jgi:predicted kinase